MSVKFARSLLDIVRELNWLTPAGLEKLFGNVETRLRALEAARADLDTAVSAVRTIALERVNNVLSPAIQSILLIQERGFLVARSDTPVSIAEGNTVIMTVGDESERAVFTPSPRVLVTRAANDTDYAVVRRVSYDQQIGEFIGVVEASFGEPGPHDDWIIAAIAGSTLAAIHAAETAAEARDQVLQEAEEVSENAGAASQYLGQTRLARDDAIEARDAASAAAAAAQTFDPGNYYPRAQTYSRTEIDEGLEGKVPKSDLVAANVGFAPAEGLAAEDVQAALEELQEDKAPAAALALHFRNMRVFLTSGTLVKPVGVDRVFAIAQGGGQGGRQDTAGSLRCGTGGDCVMGFIELTEDVTVTIGAGSAGANAGVPSAGGDTSIGALALARGGASSSASSLAGGASLPGQSPIAGIAALGGASGFGGSKGMGGHASTSTFGSGQAGFVIVMW